MPTITFNVLRMEYIQRRMIPEQYFLVNTRYFHYETDMSKFWSEGLLQSAPEIRIQVHIPYEKIERIGLAKNYKIFITLKDQLHPFLRFVVIHFDQAQHGYLFQLMAGLLAMDGRYYCLQHLNPNSILFAICCTPPESMAGYDRTRLQKLYDYLKHF